MRYDKIVGANMSTAATIATLTSISTTCKKS